MLLRCKPTVHPQAISIESSVWFGCYWSSLQECLISQCSSVFIGNDQSERHIVCIVHNRTLYSNITFIDTLHLVASSPCWLHLCIFASRNHIISLDTDTVRQISLATDLYFPPTLSFVPGISTYIIPICSLLRDVAPLRNFLPRKKNVPLILE